MVPVKNTYFSFSEEEMRSVVVRLFPRMIAYIRKILGDRLVSTTAEDIFQESICQFIEKRPLITHDKVAPYIIRIVRNNTLNIINRSHIELRSVRVDLHKMSALDTLAALESRQEDIPHTIDSIVVQDIINFSDGFSPRMQEVFYLSRVKGLTHREIAERVGISTRMVEKYLAQSVALYRQHFNWGNDEITS